MFSLPSVPANSVSMLVAVASEGRVVVVLTAVLAGTVGAAGAGAAGAVAGG